MPFLKLQLASRPYGTALQQVLKDRGNGKSHNRTPQPSDTFHKESSLALDGIGSGLIHTFPRSDIGLERGLIPFSKGHTRSIAE